MIPTPHGPCSSPQALNRALTDLLRARARHWPGVTLDSLRRQFAYDRLLTRGLHRPGCPTVGPQRSHGHAGSVGR